MKQNPTFMFGLFLIGIFFPLNLWAQAYSGKPCQSGGNSQLKTQLTSGKIEKIQGIGYQFYENWSSSYLPSVGTKPKIISYENNPQTGEDNIRKSEDSHEASDKWACMYSAYSAQDNDQKTAWCEGVKGNGIGEVLLARINGKKSAEIWLGLGKSEKLFKANNRPKEIKVFVMEATRADHMTTTETSFIYDLKILASHKTNLKDINGYQTLSLPKYKESGKPLFVAVEILSVYRGEKYRDTCITEIK